MNNPIGYIQWKKITPVSLKWFPSKGNGEILLAVPIRLTPFADQCGTDIILKLIEKVLSQRIETKTGIRNSVEIPPVVAFSPRKYIELDNKDFICLTAKLVTDDEYHFYNLYTYFHYDP